MAPKIRKGNMKKPAAAASTARAVTVKVPENEVVGTSFVLSEFLQALADDLGVKPVSGKNFILATGCSGPSSQTCNILDCSKHMLCAPKP